MQKNHEGWYWYAEDIRVPTLWDAAGRRGPDNRKYPMACPGRRQD